MEAHLVMRALLEGLPSRVAKLPVERLAHKSAPDRWSPKEEFGHLIDSAVNNHQRIVRAQLEEHPAMPGYDGDAWVVLHQYQRRAWPSLIERWKVLNQQLLAAAEAVPDSSWTRMLTVADSAPLTLQFVFDDYIHHMLDHLRHMGIEVDDFATSAKAAES